MPFNEIAREDFYFFITIFDDFSMYGYVYTMKYKHESFEKFKKFKVEVEQQTCSHAKALQWNLGGEYISTESDEFHKENGIAS